MKLNIKYNFIILALFSAIFFSACEGEQHDHSGHDHGSHEGHDDHSGHDDHGGHDDHEEHGEALHLTAGQIKTIGLEFGDFSNIKVNDYVKATGTLNLPSSAYASASAKAAGIISGCKNYVLGNRIQKGAVIAYLEQPDFIVKQQTYLETVAQLKFERLELKRQKTLVDAKAGVSKNLENAQAKVEILEAKSMGLAKQLAYLGISVSQLSPNSIQQKIAIHAPMSGYISKVNLHNGLYVQPTTSLMEIANDKLVLLELDVFEKDIAGVSLGQKINYYIPALGGEQFEAKVELIAKEFNSQNKTIRVLGKLSNEKPAFIKGLFVNAKIWLNDQTTTAVPEASIIKDGASSFIYAANPAEAKETEFEKIMVIVGASNNGFTAVKLLDEIPPNMKIVTKGAYYVYAQSKAGEMAHEH